MTVLLRAVSAIGSLAMAVGLLLLLALILAWGTLYETRFGTAAVQRFIYQSAWFQLLLGFLGLNLAVAALERYPWKRRQIPFLLAHVGIIGILIGGILGGRFGVEGQLIIPEGRSERFLQLNQSVLVVHPMNPGGLCVFPTRFETQAWVREPKALFRVPVKDRVVELEVDRYFPDARVEEEIAGDGPAENPALLLRIGHPGAEQEIWLLARDPERFAAQTAAVHLLFLEGDVSVLPPLSVCILRNEGRMALILTGPGKERKVEGLQIGRRYRHPWLDLELEPARFLNRARLVRRFSDGEDQLRQEALHLTARDGAERAGVWLQRGQPASLRLRDEEILLEYRKAVRELPVTVKLLDFRKSDYPGTQTPASFESDVELEDPQRGLVLKRTIRMNSPLKYRGFVFFQSSYLDGPVETTVLSVRKDPGTPLIYAGCLIVVAGIVGMFLIRRDPA